ncbi:MAG: NAD(P)H-dependent oxidoreductase [Lentisphaeraceae bacterium]|nr:NAD(P)H-dependent oxidoreductase [Lentisphaeraceae bacterium]
MKIVTLLGSVQAGTNTGKALQVVEDYLRQQGAEVARIDPAVLELNLPGREETADAKKIQELVKAADGIVLSTPEYHGSYSAALKLIIENLSYPSLLADKPVVMLGVAAGALGATKALEHMRSMTAHLGCFTLPKAVSVANAYRVFDKEGKCTDEDLQQRLQALGESLLQFTKA